MLTPTYGFFPTPTPGLPPEITPGEKQTCPPLAHAEVSQRSEKTLGIQCYGEYTDPEEPYRILAYAHLRLPELFANRNRAKDAKSDWEYIRTHYTETTPGYAYAALANSFWDSFYQCVDLAAACSLVRDQSTAQDADVFGPMGAYGCNSMLLSPETICPYPPGRVDRSKTHLPDLKSGLFIKPLFVIKNSLYLLSLPPSSLH
jgi:hypothetical protein